MRHGVSGTVRAGVVWVCLCAVLQAAEPVQPFVQGLRDRGYFDIALQYLDQLEQKSSLGPETRELIPFERAQTLLASARDQNSADSQRQQLDAAEAAFQQFSKASPNHPLAAQANTWRGRILFEKARVEIFESEDPGRSSERQAFHDKARNLLTEARTVFDAAAKQYKSAFDKFPSFIPEGETGRIEERARAENLYIEVLFDYRKCNYWEARTFDKDSPERTSALQKATNEFEEMFNQYRSNTGGKLARLWQGKCLEEQDQITEALGVYEDLLTITPDNAIRALLYDQALRFKLICLNHEKKKDYPLVVTLADEWLATAKGRTRSEIGNGVQWERCRSLESIGGDRERPESERIPALNQALAAARVLARTSGEFKAPANGMIQRLLLSLNRNSDDPTDFDAAFGMAGKLSDDIRALSSQVSAAQAGNRPDEVKTKTAELKTAAAEMTRLCDMALKLAKPNTDTKLIDRANVLLAYGYLLNDQLLEAAAVGDFLLRGLADRSPDSAKNAGFIAMAAFDRAWSKAPKGQRDFESRQLVAVATRLEQKFPESDQANDARQTVARVMWDERKLEGAAAWWNKVPAGSTHYASAQLGAGQAFWGYYTTQINLPADKRPNAAQLSEWKVAAIRHLEAGIAERGRTTPADRPAPDDLVRGKATLAQIRNLEGIYRTVDKTAGAIELLTQEPHSVLSGVALPLGETDRPKTPGHPKSRAMASFAYQQLLKAQIGVKDLDAARDARQELEKVAGSEDADALTQVFVEFGRELENELNQLKAAGETDRATEVREGFEAFLTDLLGRQDGQNFSSLFWIAETFTSLGESTSDDPSRATKFFSQAGDAYQKIVDNTKSDSAFAQPDQLLYTRMRLVNCKRVQGDFAGGEQVIQELLKDKKGSDSPNVQMAAASLYQAWGASSEPDAWKKYQIAIQGTKSPPMWGWGQTALRLQRALRNKPDPKIEAMEFEARYNLGRTQLALAKQQSTPADRDKTLNRAKMDLETFARISKGLPPEEETRFTSLYNDIQKEIGELPTALPVGIGAVAAAKPEVANGAAQKPAAAAPVVDPAEETNAPQSKTNVGLIVLLALAGIAAVGGILFFSMRKPPDKYASRRAAAAQQVPAPAAPKPAATSPPPAAAAPPPAKPRPTKLPGKPKADS
jgi:hypothetical protein